MRCITCPTNFPTYYPNCPDCRQANPLYGVSLKAIVSHSTTEAGVRATSLKIRPINGVSERDRVHDGTWKMALELHHPRQPQRQYVIITSASNGAPYATLWNRDPVSLQTIQQSFCCTACPYNNDIPHLIVASPLPTSHPLWSYKPVEGRYSSEDLVIIFVGNGQIAIWIFNLSHLIQ